MKVVQVGSNSIHVSSYVGALAATGQESYLLAEEPCNFAGVIEEWHVDFRSLNPFSLLKNSRKLKQLIAQLQPDVIHIHQVNRLAYFASRAAAKLRIPVITTAWGSDVLIIPKQNRFFRFLVQQTLKRSQIVTADSQEMIAAMQQIVPDQQKYLLLQYGIDPVTPAAKEHLIYSNRLHKPLYRIDRIIRYFSEFSAKYPDWKLIIGATGTETPRLEELVKELKLEDKVTFVGWLDNAANRSWYAQSAIYVSVPESDGTSVSVLEAMSAGCIPVLSDLAVSHEWIESGVNGVIETPGENPLLAAMRIDATDCAETNRDLVVQRAGRTACLQVFIHAYQQLTHAG